jgi:hypothetical protein
LQITKSREREEKEEKRFVSYARNRPTSSCLIHNNVRREIFFINIDEWLEACVLHKMNQISAVSFLLSTEGQNVSLEKAYRFRSRWFGLRPEIDFTVVICCYFSIMHTLLVFTMPSHV